MGIRALSRRRRSEAPPLALLAGVAFADAVQPHLASMTYLAARLGPRDRHDDVVQDALVRAWRHRGRFDATRGSVRGWLLTIVANEARRAARRERTPMPVAAHLATTSSDDRVDVEGALRRLAARQRLAISCFYFADLSISETAALMGCTDGTVKSTLADGRRRLRALLEG
jgi:RNA polymerase sigma-70 factor, ECF subfamily